MDRTDELRSILRLKRQAYKDLRNDYEILKQNIKSNVDAKKEMRKEIDELNKEYQELKNKFVPVEEPGAENDGSILHN